MKRYVWLFPGIFASALLTTARFPPQRYPYVAWLALVPVLVAVAGRGFIAGFLSGLAVFVLSAEIQILWILDPTHTDAGSGTWLLFGYILIGLICGIVCGLVGERSSLRLKQCLWVAVGAVVCEALLLALLPVNLGLSQHEFPFWLLLSSFSGIWGVSWMAWFANLVFAATLVKRSTPRLIASLMLLIFLGASYLVPPATVQKRQFRVAAIQTEARDIEALSDLTKRAEAQGAQLVVWPELSAADIAPRGDTRQVRKLSEKTVAFVTTFEDDASPLPYNVAALFDRGKESQRYAKRKPFAGERYQHAAGSKPVVVQTAVPLGLNICFDSCYPAVMRDTVNSGAEVIALPTLDSPSLANSVQALHNAYTPFRAAELGVPIIRAEASGYSSIVGSHGEVLAELRGGEGVITTDLTSPRATLYRRFGDWFLYLCVAALGFRKITHLVPSSRKRNA